MLACIVIVKNGDEIENNICLNRENGMGCEGGLGNFFRKLLKLFLFHLIPEFSKDPNGNKLFFASQTKRIKNLVLEATINALYNFSSNAKKRENTASGGKNYRKISRSSKP